MSRDTGYREPWLSPGRALLLLILLGAAVLRVAYLAQIMHEPDFSAPLLDPQLNDYWARAVVTGDWSPPAHAPDPLIRTTPYGRPPGYPWILAAIYRVFGTSYLVPRLVQFGVGLLNILLAYALGRRMFGTAAGLVAACLAGFSWNVIYFEGELNSPVFEVLFMLLLLHALVRVKDTGRSTWACLAGALMGAAALIRPNVLLVGVAVIVWLCCSCRRSALSRLRNAALFGLCAAAVVAPVVVRNYRVSGDFVLISYYGGVNAYIGNNPMSTGDNAKIPDLHAISGMDSWDCFTYPAVVRGMGRVRGVVDLSLADASAYFYERASQFWAGQPTAALKLTLRKALLFWGPLEVSDSKIVEMAHRENPVLNRLPGFPWMAALGLLGIAYLVVCCRKTDGPARRSREAAGLLSMLVVAGFLSILPFFIAGRYRVVVAAPLLLLSGYGIAGVIELWRAGRRRSAVFLVLAATAMLVAAHVPLAAYTPDLARGHLLRGIASGRQGDGAGAIAEFKEALRLDPGSSEAYLRLGYEYGLAGDYDRALSHYRKSVWLAPEYGLGWNNLGFELARRGAKLEAEQAYRRAAALNPRSVLPLTNLGLLFMEQSLMKEARECLDAALLLEPENPDCLNNLGLFLSREGRKADAGIVFEQALAIAPRHVATLRNLGGLLEEAGDREQAAAVYERALAECPKDDALRAKVDSLRVPR